MQIPLNITEKGRWQLVFLLLNYYLSKINVKFMLSIFLLRLRSEIDTAYLMRLKQV